MNLKEFFENHKRIAIAFSGGTDSAYLLSEAVKYCEDVMAYYVKSQFQPQFEYDDALRLAKELSAKMTVINMDVLADETVVANPSDRCYHCKNHIFGTIIKAAHKDGYPVLIDGTNASDDEGDRPGMKALKELKVLSPLRLCGIDKETVRKRSKENGLFTWDKPAYACLATRVKHGQYITNEILSKIEDSENYLMSLGFSDFRVRVKDNNALIQLAIEQFDLFYEKEELIKKKLSLYFDNIELDVNHPR